MFPTTKSTPSGFTIGVTYNDILLNKSIAGYPHISERFIYAVERFSKNFISNGELIHSFAW